MPNCCLFGFFFSFHEVIQELRKQVELEEKTNNKGPPPPVKRDFCLAICSYWGSSLSYGTGHREHKFCLVYALHKTT